MIVGILSYGFAAICFLFLSILLILTRRKDRNAPPLILASCCSLLWAIINVLLSFKPEWFWLLTGPADTIRIVSWAFFIHSILFQTTSISDKDFSSGSDTTSTRKIRIWLAILIVAQSILFVIALLDGTGQSLFPPPPIVWILSVLTSLYLLEQLYVSTPQDRRGSIRYLCVGLSAMFVFDFYLFTNIILFGQVTVDTWQARGAFYGLLVPLIALTVAKNPDWALRLHVSRQAVTSSATLLMAGAYLLATAFAASLIQVSQFEGASVVQVTFVLLSFLALALTLLSRRLRAKLRVFVSKHFFNFKYDYRQEWLKFTQALARDIDQGPIAIVEGLCNIVESESGELWGVNSTNHTERLAIYGKMRIDSISAEDRISLLTFLLNTNWLIDLDEFRAHPAQYEGLALSNELIADTAVWLVIPLPFQENIVGFVVISRSMAVRRINWEDRDLLKTAGHQAAGVLAQRYAHRALEQASQFSAFSKLSAYIVHDLKNILGQQSLIVSNAPKHKNNPEFVDDVITTVENSVNRMQSLLQQIREPQNIEPEITIDLENLMLEIIALRSDLLPIPSLSVRNKLEIQGSKDKLSRVIGHLLQNAHEATPANGRIDVSIELDSSNACITIADTGCGMSEEFIANKLFTAFESTKGLTGMGIGVFESREYIRSLGGDIIASSVEGEGSEFKLTLPLRRNNNTLLEG